MRGRPGFLAPAAGHSSWRSPRMCRPRRPDAPPRCARRLGGQLAAGGLRAPGAHVVDLSTGEGPVSAAAAGPGAAGPGPPNEKIYNDRKRACLLRFRRAGRPACTTAAALGLPSLGRGPAPSPGFCNLTPAAATPRSAAAAYVANNYYGTGATVRGPPRAACFNAGACGSVQGAVVGDEKNFFDRLPRQPPPTAFRRAGDIEGPASPRCPSTAGFSGGDFQSDPALVRGAAASPPRCRAPGRGGHRPGGGPTAVPRRPGRREGSRTWDLAAHGAPSPRLTQTGRRTLTTFAEDASSRTSAPRFGGQGSTAARGAPWVKERCSRATAVRPDGRRRLGPVLHGPHKSAARLVTFLAALAAQRRRRRVSTGRWAGACPQRQRWAGACGGERPRQGTAAARPGDAHRRVRPCRGYLPRPPNGHTIAFPRS